MANRRCELRELVMDREAWRAAIHGVARVGHDWVTDLIWSDLSDRFPVLGLQNHCGWWLQPWNQKMTASWQNSEDKPRQGVEKQRQYSADKGLYSQGYGLFSGHVWLWEMEHKESRMPKNWCLQIVVLGKTPESLLDNKEVKAVNLEWDHPWIFTGCDAEAETPVFWSSDASR